MQRHSPHCHCPYCKAYRKLEKESRYDWVFFTAFALLLGAIALAVLKSVSL